MTILTFQSQVRRVAGVARTGKTGGGWTTEVIALVKTRRQFVHLSLLKDATRMKRGESSSGADWLAGKMVLDMKVMIAQRERGVVSESAGTRKSLCVWQLQNASVLNVDWISVGNVWKATNVSMMKSMCGLMRLAHIKFLCMLMARSAPI